MSEERKQPGVGFWSAIIFTALLLYPVLFIPACWFTSHTQFGLPVFNVIYQPLLRVTYRGAAYAWPRPIYDCLFIGSASNWSISKDETGWTTWGRVTIQSN